MLKLLPFILFIFLNLQGTNILAQKIKVTTKSIEDIDNKLVIKYDLVKSKANQHFKVSLEITSTKGLSISINALSGDIGDSIPGGINKQIVWDYNADGIVLNEDISIVVIANLLETDVSMIKALALSSIWPGLGMSKMEKNGPYWLMGIVGYGSLGASVFLNKKANENYESYKENTLDELNDGFLSKSQSQIKLSKTLAYSAIGIWGINLVWTAIKAKRYNQKTISMLKKQQLFFYTGYDPHTKTKGFTLKYRF